MVTEKKGDKEGDTYMDPTPRTQQTDTLVRLSSFAFQRRKTGKMARAQSTMAFNIAPMMVGIIAHRTPLTRPLGGLGA